MIGYLRKKIYCLKHGHDYCLMGESLGGDWIQCVRCRKTEEYLPGVHEPEGYDYYAHHKNL